MKIYDSKLTRSRTDRIIAGVCGGIGQYYNIRPVLFRIGFIAITFFDGGIGLILYLLAAIFIPQSSWGEGGSHVDGVKGFIKDVQYEAQNAAEKVRGGNLGLDKKDDTTRIIIFTVIALLIIGILSPHHYWYAYRFFDLAILAVVILFLLTVLRR